VTRTAGPLRVLVVCRANVCRSPLARAVLRTSLGDGVDVVAAGTHPPVGSPACSLVRARVEAEAWLPPTTGAHAVTVADLRSADLVLGADRTVCADVIALLPAARPRVFTLREAGPVARIALGSARDAARPAGARELVGRMPAARAIAWHADAAAATGRRRRGAGPVPPEGARWDVADGHLDDLAAHERTIDAVVAACHDLVDVLAHVLDEERAARS
jgi:protein-tyrosine phosphatase